MPYRHIYAALDACKVADYVVFALSTTVEVDGWGDTLLRTLQAQGLPDVVTVVSPDSSIDVKTRPGIIKSLLSFIQYFVPIQSRVFDLESSSDRLNALRALSEGKPADVRWREGRSWVLGEHLAWSEDTLQVTGVVRGTSMSPNRLVHIPNFGDFQISKVCGILIALYIYENFNQIMSAPLTRHSKSNHPSMDVEPVNLAEPDASSADSLVSCNDPDDMANEQTWPTEEEMNGAPGDDDGEYSLPEAKSGTTPKVVKRIPKGMSEYQASWIVDESDDEDDEGDDDEKEDEEMETTGAEEEEEMVDMQMDEDNDMETDARRGVTFQDLDHEEESKQYVPFLVCFTRQWSTVLKGCSHGGTESGRKRMTSHSQMNSTPPKTCLHKRGSRGSAVCDPSERVPGIHLKTFPGTTPGFFNSKTINEQNGISDDVRSRKTLS